MLCLGDMNAIRSQVSNTSCITACVTMDHNVRGETVIVADVAYTQYDHIPVKYHTNTVFEAVRFNQTVPECIS